MGQESSSPIDESIPPQTLTARNLDGISEYVKRANVRNIVIMTGAGISTSAGIPDFRSPDTGLYANLARLNLPYPEAVFDISFFRENPHPFYALAHELYPGKYRPTIAHSFISLLNDKKMLLKCFTQNIDCLEREAGLPNDKIIEAHGSFATQRCIECRTEYSDDLMKEHIDKKEVPHCNTPQCNGLVKPDIVFFGEQLPAGFFESRSLPAAADLCIVMGTSLTVQPFASLPVLVSQGVPRILINKDRVGDLGSRADDVLLLGDIDENVKRLAAALGLDKPLYEKWQKTQPKTAFEMKERPALTRDQQLDAEINKLTGEIDASLKISRSHEQNTMSDLDRNAERSKKDLSSKDDKALRVDEKPSMSSGLTHVFPHITDSVGSPVGGQTHETTKDREEKL